MISNLILFFVNDLRFDNPFFQLNEHRLLHVYWILRTSVVVIVAF